MTENRILTFEELYKVELDGAVSKLEKKYTDKASGEEKSFSLSYLSWTFGWREMKRVDPDAREKVHEFPMFDNQFRLIEGVTVPYLKTPQGYFVRNTVTINERSETEWMPVVDNGKYPIANPNSFQINTSNKRCFVKALAKHGLGLYLYAGEDIPTDISKPVYIESQEVEYLQKILEIVSKTTETDLEILEANIRDKTDVKAPLDQLKRDEYGKILNYANHLKIKAEERFKNEEKNVLQNDEKQEEPKTISWEDL